METKKQIKKKHLFFRLIGYMIKSFPISYAAAFFMLIIASAASIGNTIFTKFLIDTVISPFQTGALAYEESFWNLVILIIIMISIYVVGLLCNYFYHRILAVNSQKFSTKVRIDLFNNMEDLPIKYFDTHKTGAIMSTYTNDIDAMWSLSAQTLPQLIVNCFTIITLFVIMFIYSIYLCLVVVFFSVIMLFITKTFGGISSKAFLRHQQAYADLEGYTQEMLTGQKVIKVFNHEKESIEGFDSYNENNYRLVKKGNQFANMLMPTLGNTGHLMYICVAILGGILIAFEAQNCTILGFNLLGIDVVVSFLLIARQFSGSISQASSQFNAIVLGLAGANRVFSLLDEPKEIDNGYVTLVNCIIDENNVIHEVKERTGHWAWKHPHEDGTTTYTLLEGDIVLNHVDFGYNPDKLVLHDISCYAYAGQKIAFVGSTGAGKTTITNLINRFYDIDDGKIRYDGININKIKKDDLRRSLAVVLQDTNLFHGTILDNIRYGNLQATDEQCIEAAKLVSAHDFITRLPNGYQTKLKGDGANLSQGQRQLISIARAAVANPPVLILDEATSSIDTRTEAIVQKGMDALMKGRTVFVIAHRLSTIRNSDAIMVLEHGQIIERGSHEDLMEKKGTYYELYTGHLELQ